MEERLRAALAQAPDPAPGAAAEGDAAAAAATALAAAPALTVFGVDEAQRTVLHLAAGAGKTPAATPPTANEKPASGRLPEVTKSESPATS